MVDEEGREEADGYGDRDDDEGQDGPGGQLKRHFQLA